MILSTLYKLPLTKNININIILLIGILIYSLIHYILFGSIINYTFLQKYKYVLYGVIVIDIIVFMFLYKRDVNETLKDLDDGINKYKTETNSLYDTIASLQKKSTHTSNKRPNENSNVTDVKPISNNDINPQQNQSGANSISIKNDVSNISDITKVETEMKTIDKFLKNKKETTDDETSNSLDDNSNNVIDGKSVTIKK